MYYVSCQGGALFPAVCAVAVELWNWCIASNTVISASYFPGIQNTMADDLSIHFFLYYEWELKSPPQDSLTLGVPAGQSVCHSSQQKMHQVLLHERARSSMHWRHVPHLIDKRTSRSISTDTIIIKGSQQDRARVILIIPMWPRQVWYPYLIRFTSCPLWRLLGSPYLLTHDASPSLHPNLKILRLQAWFPSGSQ